MEFDIVILGGGAAGCVLAARLSEDPRLQVALLEAGPPDDSVLIHCPAGLATMPHTDRVSHFLTTEPQPGLGGRRTDQPRGRTLGGSSSTNAMVYLRGQPEDFDTWAAMGNPGWGWRDVLPWFVRCEDNAQLGGPLHGQGGPLGVTDLQAPNPFGQHFVAAGVQAGLPLTTDFNGPEQAGVGMYQVMQRGGERCSAAKAYLHPIRGRSNLHIFTHTTADRIGLVAGHARTVHATRGGQTLVLHARREVVVCGGAFASPAILMRSGIGPAAHLQSHGVAVAHHLPGVGEHLQDHPDVVLVVPTPGNKDLFGYSLQAGWRLLRAAWQWQRARQGMLTTNFAEAGAFFSSQPQQTRPDIQLHMVMAQLVNHGRDWVGGHGYSVHVCALRPQSRGTVRLRDAHARSAPLIDPQFLSHPEDVHTLVRGVQMTRRILAQPALAVHGQEWQRSAHAQSDADLAQWVRANAQSIYHPVGTCRMGPDAMSVVDAQMRVHGVGSLRVADASVMPQIVSGNTTAPTLMLAERAASFIQSDLRG